MRPPAILGKQEFWFTLMLSALALVSVWLWSQNRDLINQNRESLLRICDTQTTLDLVIVSPFLSETRIALKGVRGEERKRLTRIAANLEVAHEELSDTAMCESVR